MSLGAAGVTVSTPRFHRGGAGSTPSAALHSLEVRPISFGVAKTTLERHHYLHSIPGGTTLCFGVFLYSRIMGAATFGVGSFMAYRLIRDVSPDGVVTLTRLWLSDQLPGNAESRVLGVMLRALGRYTALKAVIAYADPSAGHVGTIYQATGWLYTGLSDATPLYDLGDGKARHSRSVSSVLGTHAVQYFTAHGVRARRVVQPSKHRYVYLLDRTLMERLTVPVLPYPKKGAS